ncbi:MAG: hypothetical protein M3082_01965 [Candidatus Dormibacteraeota bacterium]|nr:hypothetical protein [Candidatus Dormibacteraeota bacterium]MDQ6917720.1 hypothetical protein [Candidatus Dormibacteraeota bacterium]
MKRAFDQMLDAPHPAFEASLRARLDAGPGPKEAGMPQRFLQLGAAAAAMIVLVVVSFSYLSALSHHGQPRPGPGSVGGSPTPSISPASSPTPVANPSCSGTYMVSGNTLTATVTTDGAPILVIVQKSDQDGDPSGKGLQHQLPRGQSTSTFTFQVRPPVTRVTIVLNGPGGTIANCEASPVG